MYTSTTTTNNSKHMRVLCWLNLVFLEHEVNINQSLLEVTELVGHILQHVTHVLGYCDLVLVKDVKLVKERRDLCVDHRQLGVKLLPQQQAFTELIQGLWCLCHSDSKQT